MIRSLVAALAVVLALVGCGDDDAPTATVPTPSSGTSACGDCRQLDVGTDPVVDGISVGVRQCADGECELALYDAATGGDTEVHLGVGDVLDVGDGWTVVVVTADGMSIRPSS